MPFSLEKEPVKIAVLKKSKSNTKPQPPKTKTVYSKTRSIKSPKFTMPRGLKMNTRLKMDGLKFLKKLPEDAIPVVFFDPQYRGILDKMEYGNEGKKRGQRRCSLEQMSEEIIVEFIAGIERTLIPTGHLFLWIDKFHLCNGYREWFKGTNLDVVDLVNWDKGRIGMGYRSRRTTEHCVVLQKKPRKAKGVWTIHNIPDTWREKINTTPGHTHRKPINLQEQLISAVSNKGDFIVDPAAGGFTVMESAQQCGRNFIGCDLNG